MELDWRSIAGAVAPYAPKLGTVLGSAFGPFGGIIGGLAGNAIAATFGVDPTPEAVGKAITEDPQAGEKLQAIEAERGQEILAQAQTEAKKLDTIIEGLKVDAGDRANARETAVQLGAQGSPLARVQKWIAITFVLGFFVLLGLFLLRPITVSEAAILMLGVLTGGVKDIVSFFFGSSAGSQSKDVILKEMATSSAEAASQTVATAAQAAKTLERKSK